MKIIKKFKLRNLTFFLFLILYSTNLYAELTQNFITAIRPGTTGFINADGNKSTRDALENPFGFFVSPDGKTIFNANNDTSSNHRCITQLGLSTPFELSTATLVDESNILNSVALRSGGRDDCHDVYLSPDGKHMSVTNEQGRIYDFHLSSPFSLRNATLKAGYLNPFVNAPIRGDDIWFSHDGSKMFVIDVAGDNLKEYTTVSPFTSNGVTLINTVDLTSETVIDGTETAHDFFFDKSGRTLMILVNDTGDGEHDDTIFQFSLSVAFDTTTLTLVGSSVISGYDGTEDNSDAVGISFGNGGTRLYIMNLNGGPNVSGKVDTLSQFNLKCPYGIAKCVSDTKASIDSQVELAKQNISLNIDTIFKRFEWIKRNRDNEELSSHNININYPNPLLRSLAIKFEPSLKNNLATLVSNTKKKEKKKKSKWSSWSIMDISIGNYEETLIDNPKDILTKGLTLGSDRKFGDNKFFGLALRYGNSESEIRRSVQEVDLESLTLNIYGVVPTSNTQYINAVLGLSALRFNNKYLGALSGERNGKQAFGSINYRTKRAYSKFNVTPTGKLTYGVTQLSEFTDFISNTIDAPTTDVRYKEDTFKSGEFVGGLLFEMEKYESDQVSVQPMGGIEIIYDLTDDITYKYQDVGATTVYKETIKGKYSRQNLKTNIGFEAIHTNGFTVSTDYQRTIRLNDKKTAPTFTTERFIIKFSKSKEDNSQFAFDFDPLTNDFANLSYAKDIGNFNLKFNSNYSSINRISDYGANIELSGTF